MHEQKFSKFGNAVYNGRISAGLTQEKLAEILGVSRRYYQRIEKGEKLPSTAVFLKLVLTFDIDIMMFGKEYKLNVPLPYNRREIIFK